MLCTQERTSTYRNLTRVEFKADKTEWEPRSPRLSTAMKVLNNLKKLTNGETKPVASLWQYLVLKTVWFLMLVAAVKARWLSCGENENFSNVQLTASSCNFLNFGSHHCNGQQLRLLHSVL